ncbi:BPTI/Kunitz domain-containing protein-like [Stegodyphus dumicola]|uniref:BPTI/Kunitz domain-containing protein-like n=1 Tax=Stegodyphus dumicola TaxID=202533 RepID=UPI0015B20885|nr:BPTI/Kunitz domain-containing protein-like [Stegodyphus dumicola]
MTNHIVQAIVLIAAVGIAFSATIQPYVRPSYENIPQCFQPPESGLCLAYFLSYYYNPSTRTCETFVYGGCQGNANRFTTFEQCMATCNGTTATTIHFELITESNPSEKEVQDPCTLPVQTGQCRAAMPRFYFNGEKCENFIYGGCDGNANNFRTLDDCEKTCAPSFSEQSGEQPIQ